METRQLIKLRKACANNLKNVDLDLPKQQITVFTGVSGSGKSSLVFDTIGAEARRQISELFSAFARVRMPAANAAEVESIENLSAAVVIDQKRLGGNSRSTVGTVTDLYALLRLLFSRIGRPAVGYSNAFSFNHPKGMCPECGGVGMVVQVDEDKMFDKTKSLNEGAILFPTYRVGSYYWTCFTCSGFFDCDKPLNEYNDEEWELFLWGQCKFKTVRGGIPLEGKYEGVLRRFNRMFVQKGTSEIAQSTREKIEHFIKYVPCESCRGARLNQAALNCRIGGLNIADMCRMEVGELIPVLEKIDDPVGGAIARQLIKGLAALRDIGLSYMTLDRQTTTLSGGESQRVKMIRHLGSSLTDMIYIFDEPSIGLHAHDVHKLNYLFRQLRDKGNTVLIVEHDPEVIRIADHVVDMGPLAGERGGQVVFQGSYDELLGADTLTARHLNDRVPLNRQPREPKGFIHLDRCRANNLKNIDVDIPQGVLCVISGVAGSGKSSLIMQEFLGRYPEAVVMDQSPVGVNARSNPATYTGLMDDIRRLFAKANKVSAALFSFNSQGACPDCQGLGFIETGLAFLEPVKVVCEECGGKRFKEEVLQYKVKDKNIADVLAMTVEQAWEFFTDKSIREKLDTLRRVGLDYLTLGQPLSTLSGGECQRIKLAGQLYKQRAVYVMDEPTTGLHMSDVGRLLAIINDLVDQGNTVIVIEHNLDVIKAADWVIDLGPEGGAKGGTVVFSGPPEELLRAESSLTGQCLREEEAQ
ncbi:MAG: excinuclease ABC subunit UvrA [Firmicutes bacterium]|nr:excinuclease ABC subunit UvrA [Bacillota bacterium]